MRSPRFPLLAAVVFAAIFSAVISCGHSTSPTEPAVVPTATPRPGTTAPPAPTSTPMPAPTPTPASGPYGVSVGAGGGNVFRDSHSGTSTTTVPVGATV